MKISKFEENYDGIQRLYESSMEGSVTTLKSLIQNDPLILSKICLTSLGETPLHVSALLGHLDYTLTLLSQKPQGPQLAVELDLLKRSPLHLASAKGNVKIVEALLQVNKEMCLVRDEDGKIPLHYASMRGHLEVIKLLINAQPESIFILVLPDHEETVLHLCIQYNHLEALKLLVESVGYENHNFLNSKEILVGYTILHLAVLLKQLESIKYLLTIPEVKAEMLSAKNKFNLTAFDMVHQLPKNFKALKIQQIFMEVINNTNQHTQLVRETQLVVLESSTIRNPLLHEDTPTTIVVAHHNDHNKKTHYISCLNIKIIRKLKQFYKWIEGMESEGNWLEDTSGSIMVVSTMIATMAFQTATTPPGGLWQDTKNTTTGYPNNKHDCSPSNLCYAGTAVLAYVWRKDFLRFLAYDTVSFLASLSVIFLLVSGAPVKNKICMWILVIAMCISLTFLTLTFLQAVYLVTPDNLNSILDIYRGSSLSWLALLVPIILFHVLRFLIWALYKLRFKFGFLQK